MLIGREFGIKGLGAKTIFVTLRPFCVLYRLKSLYQLIQYDKLIKQLIELRQTVFWLGTHHNWWTSDADLSLRREYLTYVFPKTQLLADYILLTEVARRVHDQALGPGNYHLFRLSVDLERAIHETFRQSAEHLAIKDTTPGLLDQQLARHTGGQLTDPATGPVLLGGIQDIDDDTTRAVLAKQYKIAFATGQRVFPYLN